MKKLIVFMIVLLISVSMYAEVIIQNVIGTVTYMSNGSEAKVMVGMILPDNMVISVGVNSTVVLQSTTIVTVHGIKKNTVRNLMKPSITISKVKITNSDIKPEDQKRTNISTASTRASDATKDVDWE